MSAGLTGLSLHQVNVPRRKSITATNGMPRLDVTAPRRALWLTARQE
jgi:hypothetical protein